VDDHILALGDRVELRNKHTCGSVWWRVVLLDTDVGNAWAVGKRFSCHTANCASRRKSDEE
jgi:hypothetical protein